jgi:hypothetical protein
MTTVVYLDPSRVTDQRQGEPPRNPYRGEGYGPKIPSSWELQIDGKRWHRVYVMQWSNMGTPYVLVKGQQLLLGSYEPGGAARARARELASRRDPARIPKPRAGTLYISWSSVFDDPSVKYDIPLFMDVLKRAGARRVWTDNAFGWSNQPKVVLFTGLRQRAAEDALTRLPQFRHRGVIIADAHSHWKP